MYSNIGIGIAFGISLLFSVPIIFLFLFDLISPFVFLETNRMLYNTCNDVGYGSIYNITRIDDFQCNVFIQMPKWNHTLEQIQCHLLKKCIVLQNCNHTFISYNHYNPSKCLKIIMSKNDVPYSYYQDQLDTLYYIYICWIVSSLLILLGYIIHIYTNPKTYVKSNV